MLYNLFAVITNLHKSPFSTISKIHLFYLNCVSLISIVSLTPFWRSFREGMKCLDFFNNSISIERNGADCEHLIYLLVTWVFVPKMFLIHLHQQLYYHLKQNHYYFWIFWMDVTLTIGHSFLFVSFGNKTITILFLQSFCIYDELVRLHKLLLSTKFKILFLFSITHVAMTFIVSWTLFWSSFRRGMTRPHFIVNNCINIRCNWSGLWTSNISWSLEYLCPKHF